MYDFKHEVSKFTIWVADRVLIRKRWSARDDI